MAEDRPRQRTPPSRLWRTSPRAAARSASFRRRRRSCSSGSSTSPAACSSCCTRRSAAASTRRGGSRCASASAASSTSSCRRRRPKTRCCCRSGRSTRSRSSDVFRYLHPETTRDVLVQAFLDAPVFKTRWRWNTTISLAVPRSRGGRKVAPQLQRMLADDLMAAVFPDAAACLENIPGDRADSRSSAGHPDRARLPRGGDGLRRPARGARAHPSRRAAAASRATRRSRRVFAHEILNAQPVRVPRRCAARGAAEPRGADAAGRRTRRRPAISARSTPPRSRGCARRSVRIRATPTSCTTRC